MMTYRRVIIALAGLVLILSAAHALERQSSTATSADLIVIEKMAQFGPLERPGVGFPHDRHTKIMDDRDQECGICHPSVAGQSVYLYNRTSDRDRQTTLDQYHDGCIGCHDTTARAGETTGPRECGACHQRRPSVIPEQHRLNFDRSLHQRHLIATENECQVCHHGYNEDSGRVVYQKGEEIACRSCHPSGQPDDPLSYRTAAHRTCIDCHRQAQSDQRISENQVIWNSTCAGCHDAERLDSVEKTTDIARLDRGQPDTTFVKSFDDLSEWAMGAVVFDHQRHETMVPSCTTCHHRNMDRCESCHTAVASADGGGVTLVDAMHHPHSERSCFGCHTAAQQERTCVGCHSLIDTRSRFTIGTGCSLCHTVPLADIRRAAETGQQLRPSDFAGTEPESIDLEAVPEEVLIDAIAADYPGVLFLHRDHIESLTAAIADNRMATVFHQGDQRICGACHHRAEGVVDPPPACISCHRITPALAGDDRPTAQAAYHQQCYSCHETMDIWRREDAAYYCAECHEQ
jgi:hypothetical protein